MRLLEFTHDSHGKLSPILTVAASYLPNFGFDVGTKVVVEITKGQILIKPVNDEVRDAL